MTETLSEERFTLLVQKAAQMSVFLKSPERVRKIVEDIVQHFKEKIGAARRFWAPDCVPGSFRVRAV